MLINTTYRHSPVGTGVYTRNLVEALPEARSVRLPERAVQADRYAHWGKRAVELAMTGLPQHLVHPYWSVDHSPRHLISALDTVQFREATRHERGMLRSAARRCGGLLSLSEWSGAAVSEAVGRPCVVAPPISDTEWYDLPVRPQPAGDRLRIAFWGGFHPRKGFAGFLRTLAASSLRDDVTVVTSGICTEATPVAVESRGRLAVPDLVEMVDSCDLAVFPSSEEGWGLPIGESLLRGRPVLCADLPVYREFATGDGMTVVADWTDADCLERAVADSRATFTRRSALLEPERADSMTRLRNAVLGAWDR